MNPEKVRCQIIEYTKHEMYLHGADGLTMDDIAKGMKMSKRTLYKLFPVRLVCSASVFMISPTGSEVV